MLRILSLDDEPEMGKLIGLILDRVGYDLWASSDSYEAWALLHTLPFDLLMQDIMRRDMDGWEFHRLMRADERMDDVPIVFATAAAQKIERKVASAVNVYIDGYITKPFSPQELIAAVRDVLLKRGKRVPPEMKPRKMSPDDCLAALHDADSQKRRAALVVWGWGEHRRNWPIEPPIQALEDTESVVRLAAVKTLKRLKDRRAVEPLIALLDDEEIEVRLATIQALGLLRDKQAVEPLIERLKGSHAATRWAVALALGRLKARQAIEPLIAALDDESTLVRIMAVLSLGRIGTGRAVAPLKEMLADDDVWIRQSAALALNQLGRPGATEPYRRIGQ
jgi:CheY-like chemotaxis protein